MNMLATLTTDAAIAHEKDSVGSSFAPLDSALYPTTVTMAHLNKSEGGALALVLTLKTADDKEIRQSLWMTSGTAKGCKNYYEKDGEKHYLPGFNLANSLCLLTLGQEISELATETKVIKLYSSEAKAEIPTKVEVLVDLLGKEVLVGLIKQTVDKNVKTDAGYVATGETREENEIDKFFRARDRMTTAEIRAQAEEATFAATWEAKWTGKVKEKAKGAAAAGTAGAPRFGTPASAATKKPATSLFA